MAELTLVLPWPPSVNTYWRALGSRVILSEHGRRYRERLAPALARMHRRFDGPVAVTLDCYPPDRRTRDLDNICKAVLDTITHAGIWQDDSQVDRLHLERCSVDPPGRVVVTIEDMPERGRLRQLPLV